MWRFALSAIVAASLTSIVWAVTVDGTALMEAASNVGILLISVLVATFKIVVWHVFDLRKSQAPTTVEGFMTGNAHLRLLVCLYGGIVGVVLSIAALLAFPYVDLIGAVLSFIVFLVFWFVIESSIKSTISIYFAEQVAAPNPIPSRQSGD